MSAHTSFADLSAELVLRVLAHLGDARDIIHFGRTSKRLQELASDGLLWRRLFIQDFLLDPKEARRAGKRRRVSFSRTDTHIGSSHASSSREILHLPHISRVPLPPGVSAINNNLDNEKLDWYSLYRVSKNWQVGRFNTQRLRTETEPVTPLRSSTRTNRTAESTTAQRRCNAPTLPDTLVASRANIIFTASRRPREGKRAATIHAFASGSEKDRNIDSGDQPALASYESPCFLSTYSDDKGSPHTTALALDSNFNEKESVRLAITYSDGSTSIAAYHLGSNTFTESLFVLGDGHRDTVVTSAFHSPYFARCTADFRIQTYILERAGCSLRRIDERRSYSSYWPACLRLEASSTASDTQTSSCARLSVVYTSPTYPRGWTIGLQEMTLSADSVVSTRSAIARQAHINTHLDLPAKIGKARFASLKRQDYASQDEEQVLASRLTSMSYEHPFIVVGSQDNDAACFRVHGVAQDVSVNPRGSLGIDFVQTLHGHTGSVHSVSLNEGRCVTGGSDGSVRVWRLGDEELSIARATGLLATLDGRIRRGLGKVVSLRLGTETLRKRKRDDANDQETSTSTSLSSILRRTRLRRNRMASLDSTTLSESTHSIVRWVSSSFDRIISVSSPSPAAASTSPCPSAGTCREEARDEEQVQIWSFAA